MEALVVTILLIGIFGVAAWAFWERGQGRMNARRDTTPSPIRTVRQPPSMSRPIRTVSQIGTAGRVGITSAPLPTRPPAQIRVASAGMAAQLPAHAECGWCGDLATRCVALDKGPMSVCPSRGCHNLACHTCLQAHGGRCPGGCGHTVT